MRDVGRRRGRGNVIYLKFKIKKSSCLYHICFPQELSESCINMNLFHWVNEAWDG